MAWLIRKEEPRDRPGIYRVHFEAFGRDAKPRIVDGLRGTEDWVADLSLVAEVEGEIVGHVLLSRIGLQEAVRPVALLALGPVAVVPAYQKQGAGSELIREVLGRAAGREFDGVVVLGHAEYYPRFGFTPASRFGIKCPFPAPDDNYLALELREGGLAGTGGTVAYPAPWLHAEE